MIIFARTPGGSAIRGSVLMYLIAAAATPAAATCGSTTCFLSTGTREGMAGVGEVQVDLTYAYIDQDRKLDGTDRVPEVLTPRIDFENQMLEPNHHREIGTRSTLIALDLGYGLTQRLTLTGVLPLYNVRAHEHFDEVGTPNEHFSNQDGTTGFGDVQVGARYAFAMEKRDLLVAGLSLKLPTGPYHLLDSEGEINEPTIEPGTGSTDLIASIQYSRLAPAAPAEWFATGSYRRNNRNSLDYRMGDETLVSAGLRRRPGRRAAFSVQVNARRTARDDYRGEGVPSTGATLVNLTPGVRFSAAAGSSIYAFVQLPVYQDVHEAQLAPRYSLLIGFSRRFD
jgi:outer membrane putative beta-barrel porin/alpha-amylase